VDLRHSGRPNGRIALLHALATAIAILLATAAGCIGQDQVQTSPDVLTVAVTIPPQQEFVERVGGDRVHVILMVPQGASPHTHEPTPGQLAAVADADMYAKVGSGIEFERAWMDKIVGVNRDMLIVDCSEGVSLIAGDPHIWLSPTNAKIMVENIYRGLVQLDPEHREYYRRNMEQYRQELDRLDATIAGALSGMESRTIMVYHPAWTYLARDYDLEQIPIEDAGKEPTPRGIEHLIRQARSENTAVIFASPEYSTQSAGTIADEIGGEVVLVSPLKKEYLENMRTVAEAFARSAA